MWRRTLALGAMLAAVTRPLVAQQPWMPEGQYAVTFCRNGRAESWILASAASSVHREALLAHEAVHREQAAQFPTCEAFYASITTPERLIDVEIPAYCAQLGIEVAHGAALAATAREMMRRLAALAQQPSRARELEARLVKACPLP